MKSTIRHGQYRTCLICAETVMKSHVVNGRITICLDCAEKLPEALEKAEKRDERTLFEQ